MKPAILHKQPAVVFSLLFIRSLVPGQTMPPSNSSPSEAQTGTSNDLFFMFGSDFVRPGLAPQGKLQHRAGPYFRRLEEGPRR